MKKFMTGLVAGLLLVIALPVGASTIYEKLTATVRPDYTVEINGDSINLSNHVVTINGSSYLPIREVSNLLGADVDFKDGVIVLSIEQEPVAEVEQQVELTQQQQDQLQFEWDLYVGKEYESLKASIIRDQEMATMYKNALERIEAGTLQENPDLHNAMLDTINANISSYERKISDIESKYPQARGAQ